MDFDLSTPIITFSGENAAFTLANAMTSVLIVGGTGAGKTSSSSKLIATRFLQAGFGGLVLICKPEEKQIFQDYCRQAGRLDDLVIVEPGGEHYFNFIEVAQKTSGLSYADNIFRLIETVIRASTERETGQSNDVFWDKSLRALVMHLIDLSLLAFDKVDVQTLYDLTLSAPKPEDNGKTTNSEGKETVFSRAVRIAKAKVRELIDAYQKIHETYLSGLNEFEYEAALVDAIPEYRKFTKLHQFFMNTYYNVTSKTRGIIDFSVTGFLEELLREPIYSLFCKQSTFSPDDCYKSGKIVLINLPIMTYERAGQYAQQLVKYTFQKAWEKRNVIENDRPVFIFADEAQNVLLPNDADFQAMSRGNRISVVYITQNLSGIYSNMGGANSTHKVESLLGTYGTQIFHANTHQKTNKYASELIGQYYMEDHSRSTQLAGDFNVSESSRYELQYAVQPSEFLGLRTGGTENDFICEAYVVMQGKKFANGAHFKKVRFNQNVKP